MLIGKHIEIDQSLAHPHQNNHVGDRILRPCIEKHIICKSPLCKGPLCKDPFRKDPFRKGPFRKGPLRKGPLSKGPFYAQAQAYYRIIPYVNTSKSPFILLEASQRPQIP